MMDSMLRLGPHSPGGSELRAALATVWTLSVLTAVPLGGLVSRAGLEARGGVGAGPRAVGSRLAQS